MIQRQASAHDRHVHHAPLTFVEQVKAMIDLRRAYSASDVHQFLRVLRDRRNHISEDEFMRACVMRASRGSCWL